MTFKLPGSSGVGGGRKEKGSCQSFFNGVQVERTVTLSPSFNHVFHSSSGTFLRSQRRGGWGGRFEPERVNFVSASRTNRERHGERRQRWQAAAEFPATKETRRRGRSHEKWQKTRGMLVVITTTRISNFQTRRPSLAFPP